ncbi:hypothetical protein GWI33_018777 [Rhynchophorus ferrugineus]|uniref:RFX-type winged-helix domain-containing protein n=1 Tax=Rhynchophorus ferrugineus TaxID=354439 RepID=A0A834HZI5_RHYFE|nr:hypothetical protein GWI33_018777 [Rhynchophorus ferrugineus]
MENEQWPDDYQQSVTAVIERPTNNLNNGNTKCLAVEKPTENALIKEDPDANSVFPEIKREDGPTNVLSEKSLETVEVILSKIKTLTQNEKYYLCLKLPGEVADIVDPFRQPLNPLGSRSEISRTIVWIQTHLEEDPNISLPKKEVYDVYEQYCKTNNIKSLSQADFGKVMKQVFPNVRARRLGQRGNSKYCYSGLRRSVSLKTPFLPDLSDKPLSTEAPTTQSSLTYAAWLTVKDWAQQQLGVHFTSLQSLAVYLVKHCSFGSGSDSANKLTCSLDSQGKEDTVNKDITKHRVTQLQLQKKIQQRSEDKDRKRKLQASIKSEPGRPGAKKCRSQSVPASSISSALTTAQDGASGENSTASSSCGSNSNSVSPTQGRINCDKPSEFTQLTTLPDFHSFQKPVLSDVVCNGTGGGQEKTNPTVSGIVAKKMTIPKLQSSAGQSNSATSTKTPRGKAKYKVIQSRLQTCDIPTYNAPAQTVTTQTDAASLADSRSQQLQCLQEDDSKDKIIDKCENHLNECDDDFPLTRERLESISNVEKDAMDEYLGTNNSQHEEELSKYFNGSEAVVDTNPNNREQLSALRQLLEENEKKVIVSSTSPSIDVNLTLSEAIPASTLNALAHNASFNSPTLPTIPGNSGNVRRRVSFETPEESVPPSPNTRSKNFNFTPISPGPHSPSSAQSKCSSTNASPFVSPRNTPIPRTKNTTRQNTGIMLSHENRKSLIIKKEPDLPLEIPTAMKNYMPMSASSTPMLQQLLNSNNKIQYCPKYTSASKIPPQPDPTLYSDISRSQSVPLYSAIPPDESLISDIQFCDIPGQENHVKRFFSTLEAQPCDNNNIGFNLDISASNSCLPEFTLNLNSSIRNITRSQSMESTYDVNKCNPSRSVPSTPLPFTQDLKVEAVDGSKSFQTNSGSYTSTPLSNGDYVFQVNSDCLLNGQPIRTDASVNNIEFLSSFGAVHEKGFQLEGDFAVMETNDGLIGDDDILIQQTFNGNIN